MFRWLTAGECAGRALVAICEGMPAGVQVSTEDVAAALGRRRAGYGRGARMTFERDEVELTGGVRHGRTLGGPVAIRIANTEWPKWETVMSPDPVDAATLASQAKNAPLTRPRPGHADLAGMQKFGHTDARPVLERASARETAARVALGDGFTTAARRGSVAHDEIEAGQAGVKRRTNRAGGIEGGMSTGEVIRLRGAMKPISTVPRALDTIDTSTREPAKAINQRSDVTAVPAAGVVAEAMVAPIPAEAAAGQFGRAAGAENRRHPEAHPQALLRS